MSSELEPFTTGPYEGYRTYGQIFGEKELQTLRGRGQEYNHPKGEIGRSFIVKVSGGGKAQITVKLGFDVRYKVKEKLGVSKGPSECGLDYVCEVVDQDGKAVGDKRSKHWGPGNDGTGSYVEFISFQAEDGKGCTARIWLLGHGSSGWSIIPSIPGSWELLGEAKLNAFGTVKPS